jgi:soluble lytic murein transglycosylase
MRVPEAQREVQQQGLPDARLTVRANAETFLNPTGQAAAGLLGQAFGAAEKSAVDIAGQQAEEADQARFLEARNATQTKINTALFDPRAGYFQKQGAAAFEPGADGTSPGASALNDLRTSVNDTANGLGNARQKRLYLEWANQSLTHVGGQIQQHEGQQFRVFQRGVGLAALDTNKQTMGLNYNNPALLQSGIDGIYAAADKLAKLEGYPAEYGKAQGQKAASEALLGAANSALAQGDHASAVNILHDYSAHLDTNDMLGLYQKISQADDARAALVAANATMGAAGNVLQSNEFDRFANITFNSESGGKHFDKNGGPLTSEKGAVGIGQILPGTAEEWAKKAGIPWRPDIFNRAKTGDAATDAETVGYHKAVSVTGLNSLLQQYHGNTDLAWAAYNAGPGAVREAQAKAVKEGGFWLGYMPAETQNYVAKNRAALAAGEGRNTAPTLAELQRQAVNKLGPAATPNAVKLVTAHVADQFEVQQKAVKQRSDEAVAEAYRQVLAGVKFADLPLDVQSNLAAFAPEKADDVKGFSEKLAKNPDYETTSRGWETYYKLMSNRELLRSVNLLTFRPELGDSEFKQLAERQNTQAAPGTKTTAVRGAGDILNQFMREAGIDPTPKDGDRDGAIKVGKIWSAYDQRVTEFEGRAGHKASTRELEQIAGKMFTQVGVKGLLWDSSKPAVLVDAARDRLVTPEVDRAQIVAALRELHPGREVTEQEITAWYLRGKGL